MGMAKPPASAIARGLPCWCSAMRPVRAAGASARCVVAGRAFGAVHEASVDVAVTECPCSFEWPRASPAVVRVAGGHAAGVGAACGVVGGGAEWTGDGGAAVAALGRRAARLVPRSLVLVAPAAFPFADARAVEAGPLHCLPHLHSSTMTPRSGIMRSRMSCSCRCSAYARSTSAQSMCSR